MVFGVYVFLVLGLAVVLCPAQDGLEPLYKCRMVQGRCQQKCTFPEIEINVKCLFNWKCCQSLFPYGGRNEPAE